MSETFAKAAACLARGQALEAAGTAASLAEALRCYDEAIASLRRSETEDSAPVHPSTDLAIAWMNRGNALLKLGSTPCLVDAANAYDEAIAILGTSAFEKNSAARNSLGAAWMNRGLAFHRQPGTKNLEEAARSQREAIAVLQTLPPGENPSHRRNLAAARLNLANVLLDSPLPDRFIASREAARAALALCSGEEKLDLIAADLALKARRCLCDALGHQLSANETAGISNDATAAEASDTIDASLALIRQWEQRGVQNFRPLAIRFFRFGAHFYRLHQPHFLAEFVLEMLDPKTSPGAISGDRELHAIAEDALALAIATLRRSPVFIAGNPDENRLLQTFRELHAAKNRLAELQPAS